MDVRTGFAVVADRDIVHGAQDFAPFSVPDLLVNLIVEIEPSDPRSLESADGRERRCCQLGVVRKLVSAANASSPESKITTRV
jgi:hypothetical protein